MLNGNEGLLNGKNRRPDGFPFRSPDPPGGGNPVQQIPYKGINAEMPMRTWICTVIFGLFLSLFAFPTDTCAQKRRRSYSSSSIYLEPQFFILRDENIFGQACKGPGFSLGYNQLRQSIWGFSRYEAAMAAGAAMGGGTMGINLHIKPLDLAGGWPLFDDDEISLYLGAYVAMNYYLQVFSELDEGRMFWFTFLDAGPRLILDKNIKNKPKFRFQVATSLGGLVSRPVGPENGGDQEPDHTAYHELTAVDIISNIHSNLQPGSFNLLNHTDIELEWRHVNKMGLSVAYRMEYFGYFQGARLDYLVNSVCIRLVLGGEVK
jgi:hypothetical protein